MEEQTLDISDYLSALNRRKVSIIIIASVVFLLGSAVAMLLPATYKSTATILIKGQDIPSELVRSTVTSFAAQRIQVISQKVMARSNLLEIIDKYNLFADERKQLTTEAIIEEMRENISLDVIDAAVVDPRTGRPTAATIAFGLSFTGENPSQVQQVANELMSLYLQENLKERSEQASETYQFLSNESDRLVAEIAELEAQLAVFKEKHVHSLPELQTLNMNLIDRAEREIDNIGSKISSQEQTKVYLQSQLAQLKPFGADSSLDPKTRLQALRTQHLALLARYSPDHPDVIRTQREIEGLELEVGEVDSSAEQMKQIDAIRSELATLRKKYSDEHPDVVRLQRSLDAMETSPPASDTGTRKGQGSLASAAADNPDNPVYIQIQTQIEAANTEIRSLENKRADLEVKLSEYEQRLVETPQVEREYSELKRRLNYTTTEYQSIHAKLVAAEIAQELEKDSKGERFEIIEPPVRPEKPVSPNRPALVIVSLVLGLGLAIGYAIVAETMDDSIRSGKVIATTVGAAPLAVIPYIANDSEIKKRKNRTIGQITATAAALILLVFMAHYFWKPLDVLWYKTLRKADVAINT